jgi:hypothetical protein
MFCHGPWWTPITTNCWLHLGNFAGNSAHNGLGMRINRRLMLALAERIPILLVS